MFLVKAFDTTRTSMVIRLSSTSLVPRSSPGCRPSVDRVRLRVAPLIMRPTPAATTPGDFKPGDRDRPHEKRRAHHRCNLGQGIRRSGRQPRYVSLVEAGGFADVAPVLGGREALGEGRKLLGSGGTLHRLAVARGQHARPQRSHLPDGALGGVPIGGHGRRWAGDLPLAAQHAQKRVGVHGGQGVTPPRARGLRDGIGSRGRECAPACGSTSSPACPAPLHQLATRSHAPRRGGRSSVA